MPLSPLSNHQHFPQKIKIFFQTKHQNSSHLTNPENIYWISIVVTSCTRSLFIQEKENYNLVIFYSTIQHQDWGSDQIRFPNTKYINRKTSSARPLLCGSNLTRAGASAVTATFTVGLSVHSVTSPNLVHFKESTNESVRAQ